MSAKEAWANQPAENKGVRELFAFAPRWAKARKISHVPFSCPLRSSFAGAIGGLLIGSAEFVDRIRRQLADRPQDRELPQLTRLRHRPPLEQIAKVVADHFGIDVDQWRPGSRHDDASRAVAAFLARREFGYSAKEVATILRYRSHGGVRNAIARVENGTKLLRREIGILRAKLT